MKIDLYWCRGEGRDDPNRQNFGDYLSPLIVEMVSGKPVQYAPVKTAQLMAIGSVLHREEKRGRSLFRRPLNVWGAGTDRDDRTFSSRPVYHAVRGRYSAEQIRGTSRSPALGDPGLLAGEWWSGRGVPAKQFKVGVIPHYVDQQSPVISAASKLAGVKIIDVYAPVEQVLKEVQQCHAVLSSSMHGLIVCDAFGIPNKRVVLSRGTISDFKFVDYYSAFGMPEPPGFEANQLLEVLSGDVPEQLADYHRPGLDTLKKLLIQSFPKALA